MDWALLIVGLTGGCTVAIVLLNQLRLEDLPGQPPNRRIYDRSVTTFNKIFAAGQFVYEVCVLYGRPRSPEWSNGSPGWNNAGKAFHDRSMNVRLLITISVGSRHSVGLFIWTTNSEMDIRISNGPWYNANNTLESVNSTGTVDTS